ncbi:electron transporter RnfC [Pseudodesulfovibrio tunisiensis]|uniref:electron transporter RnfC n=1 Tax=Pseudodesulfovibrio tunisiensis TaxID=463192 RepID=UPI001FB3A1AE|nr:electron transporter RnfC [Pseudodesulfovibrio tunisiensis]
MTSFSFSLLTGETGPLTRAPEPDRLRIPSPCHEPLVREGETVAAGQKIAAAEIPGKGDMHAPLGGTVENVRTDHIAMTTSGSGLADSGKIPGQGGEPLREWLRSMGADVSRLGPARDLIVNAVPPEPGITAYDPLLRDYRKMLELGLETIQKFVNPTRTHLIVANGNRANAFSNCNVVHVPARYPEGLDQLVLRRVTGREYRLDDPLDNAAITNPSELYLIGRLMESGRPITQTVLTIAGRNVLAHVGTPVGLLFESADISPAPGDRVVIGGLMRGITAVNLEQGVNKGDYGLSLVRMGEYPETSDAFCIGCAECERHCPARIMPGMISRCAEFKQFHRAEAYQVDSCIECGICGYWCTARRPLLHYIRYAKQELALLRGACDIPEPDQSKATAGEEA